MFLLAYGSGIKHRHEPGGLQVQVAVKISKSLKYAHHISVGICIVGPRGSNPRSRRIDSPKNHALVLDYLITVRS